MAGSWSGVLRHQGAWQGQSQTFNAKGECEKNAQSRVILTPSADQQWMGQRNEYYDLQGRLTNVKEWQYSSLSRSVHFFEDGAFSQGSTQYGPWGDFGTEFGLIVGDQRLRGVILYHDGILKTITLIQETREGTTPLPQPPLTPDQLQGHWQGTATTFYPDLRPSTISSTTLEISFDGATLKQSLAWDTERLDSTAAGDGQLVRFNGPAESDLTCWPGGASTTLPRIIPRQQSFFLELAWLVTPERRLRLMRHYDQAGGWQGLTRVEEHRMISEPESQTLE